MYGELVCFLSTPERSIGKMLVLGIGTVSTCYFISMSSQSGFMANIMTIKMLCGMACWYRAYSSRPLGPVRSI